MSEKKTPEQEVTQEQTVQIQIDSEQGIAKVYPVMVPFYTLDASSMFGHRSAAGMASLHLGQHFIEQGLALLNGSLEYDLYVKADTTPEAPKPPSEPDPVMN